MHQNLFYVVILLGFWVNFGAMAAAQDPPHTAHAASATRPGTSDSAPPEQVTRLDAGPLDFPAGRLMERDYWKYDANLVLAEVTGHLRELPPEKTDGLPNYDIKILTDIRGAFKPGEHIKLGGTFIYGSLATVLYYKIGAVILIGITHGTGDEYGFCSCINSPIGWDNPRVIPEQSVAAVKAALGTLRTVLPKAVTDPLNRAKALECFNAKDYETWAIGAAMLSAEGSKEDDELIADILNNPNTDLRRALWRRDGDIANFLIKHSPQLCEFPVPNPSTSMPDAVVSTSNGNAPSPTTNAAPPQVVADDPPAVRLMGRHYWEHGGNLILGKMLAVVPKPTVNADVGYQLEVLADARWNYGLGDKVVVLGQLHPAKSSGVPQFEKGAVVLLSARSGADKTSLIYDPEDSSPIGWRSPRVIPKDDVKTVRAALYVLRTVVPKHFNDPLDRDKALELLRSKDYETWALAVSMLAADHGREDDDFLWRVSMIKPTVHLTAQRALWVVYFWLRSHGQTTMSYGMSSSFSEALNEQSLEVGARFRASHPEDENR